MKSCKIKRFQNRYDIVFGICTRCSRKNFPFVRLWVLDLGRCVFRGKKWWRFLNFHDFVSFKRSKIIWKVKSKSTFFQKNFAQTIKIPWFQRSIVNYFQIEMKKNNDKILKPLLILKFLFWPSYLQIFFTKRLLLGASKDAHCPK